MQHPKLDGVGLCVGKGFAAAKAVGAQFGFIDHSGTPEAAKWDSLFPDHLPPDACCHNHPGRPGMRAARGSGASHSCLSSRTGIAPGRFRACRSLRPVADWGAGSPPVTGDPMSRPVAVTENLVSNSPITPLALHHLHQLPPEVSDQILAITLAEKKRTVRQAKGSSILLKDVRSMFPARHRGARRLVLSRTVQCCGL